MDVVKQKLRPVCTYSNALVTALTCRSDVMIGWRWRWRFNHSASCSVASSVAAGGRKHIMYGRWPGWPYVLSVFHHRSNFVPVEKVEPLKWTRKETALDILGTGNMQKPPRGCFNHPDSAPGEASCWVLIRVSSFLLCFVVIPCHVRVEEPITCTPARRA